MKTHLWQLTEADLFAGNLTLAKCDRCGGRGIDRQVVLTCNDGNLRKVEREIVCGCRELPVELWQRAIYMIQDFPYTGIGLGTFSRVAPVLYPFFLIGPDVTVPHSHNMFLQAGVDLGIPGLVAFIALLTAISFTAVEAVRMAKSTEFGPLAIGLFGGFLVYLTHGLLDYVTHSTKPGIVIWAIIRLIVALYRQLYYRDWAL